MEIQEDIGAEIIRKLEEHNKVLDELIEKCREKNGRKELATPSNSEN